jgi:hypothetical protein
MGCCNNRTPFARYFQLACLGERVEAVSEPCGIMVFRACDGETLSNPSAYWP